MLRIGLVVLLLALRSAAAAVEDEKPAARVVTYHDEKLTIHVHQAPMREVIDEVGKQSGAEIKGQLANPRDVSVDFDELPLREALQRVLRDQNFAIGYADDGRLRSIQLLGGPLAAPEKTETAKAAPAGPADDGSGRKGYRGHPFPADVKPSADALWNFFMDDSRQLRVSGRLAEALGSKHATFRQLATTAARGDDPAIRSRAMLAGMNVIESDPNLSTAFAQTLNSLGDDDIAHFLRQFAGEHAEEWVVRFANHTRSDQFRGRMSPVLQELSQIGPEK